MASAVGCNVDGFRLCTKAQFQCLYFHPEISIIHNLVTDATHMGLKQDAQHRKHTEPHIHGGSVGLDGLRLTNKNACNTDKKNKV